MLLTKQSPKRQKSYRRTLWLAATLAMTHGAGVSLSWHGSGRPDSTVRIILGPK